MIGRVLLPGSPMFAAVLIGQTPKEEIKTPVNSKTDNMITKPSELPLYAPLKEPKIPMKKCHKPSKVAEGIEEGVRTVRMEVTKVTDMVGSQKHQLERYYVDAMKETQHIRNYLQEEDNTLPRVGAIAVGGLAGVVFGVRGGFFRKLFYASIVGGGVASVCYPRDAKKYATVAYNFAYGIKPGDERQKDLPKFPTTFTEFSDNVVCFSKMAYEAAFPEKK